MTAGREVEHVIREFSAARDDLNVCRDIVGRRRFEFEPRRARAARSRAKNAAPSSGSPKS